MNENELKNNTNENNVVTPVEPVVSENTDTASTPEVTQINEPEVATPAVDETPAVETPVAEAPSVEPQTNASTTVENVVASETNKKKNNKKVIAIIILLVGALLVVAGFVLNGSTESNNSGADKPIEKPNTTNGTLIEDVTISGHMCMGENCTFSVILKDEVDYVEYAYNGPNVELVKSLSDYDEYVKVNIYVTGEGENAAIVNYELFNKSTNEKIEGVTTEAELRTVLGMYNVGTHTAEFTMVEIGSVGFGFGDNDESYTYRNYTLADAKGYEYEMKYINPGTELDSLVEGNKYTVTFEVTEGTFDYEYTIKEIK